jgi:xanthine dehydrogenase YagS FAD-binding subunit
MKAFAYVDAKNEAEAVAALSPQRGRTLPLAGGMDVLALMKDYIVQPEALVNVKALDGAITVSADGGVRIGASARLADVAQHADLGRLYPALTKAAADVGTPQIRHSGTVGGNLMQRPRCWYFRNEEFHCLKKGGAVCYAVEGENQYHAIFGESPCHIVHPSSLAVPILAYGGRMRVVGPDGEREIEGDRFFLMPDRNMYGETALEPNELVTHVILPARKNVRSAHYEVKFKQSHDWPIVMASVALAVEGDIVRSARVVMGAVAPVPWRARAAEAALTGKKLTPEVVSAAADAAVEDARPMSQNAYKVRIARTTVHRALRAAAGLGDA